LNVVVEAPTIGLDEAARFLHMAPSTLRERAAAGKLSAYKPGKTWVFLQDELLNYLKSTKAACPFIIDPTPRIGGPDSNSRAMKSASRLAREIAAKRKSLKL
jgi:excisionase family DNA binding protein